MRISRKPPLLKRPTGACGKSRIIRAKAASIPVLVSILFFSIGVSAPNTAARESTILDVRKRQEKTKDLFTVFKMFHQVIPGHSTCRKETPTFPEKFIPCDLKEIVSQKEIEAESSPNFLEKKRQQEKARKLHNQYEEDYRRWKEEKKRSTDTDCLVLVNLITFLAVIWGVKHFKELNC